jgi:hypothetical protein
MVVGVLLGAAFFLLRPATEPSGQSAAPSRDAVRSERREELRHWAARPPPPARGTLSVRGRVVGVEGPVAGVLVSALPSRPPEGPEVDFKRLGPGGCEDSPELALYLEEREALEDEEAPRAWALTDERGAFQLDGLEAGTVLLWAQGADEDVAVRADVPAGSADVELRVSPGRFFSGTVLGAQGEPLAGAHVLALLEGLGHAVRAVSAEDGRFRVGPLPFQSLPALVAVQVGRLPATWRSRTEARDGLGVPLSLSSPRTLSGRVMDERGPVAGARVEVSRGPRLPARVTDAQGRFQLGPLCQEVPELTAFHGGRYARQALEPRRDTVELVLSGATLRLEGRVQDSAGRPVTDAEVTLSLAKPAPPARQPPPPDSVVPPLVRQTQARGTFSFEPLVPDDYVLRLQAPHRVPQTRPLLLLASTEELTVTLADAPRIEGRVVDARGLGLEGARVSAGPSTEPVRTDARGDFQLDVPEPQVRVTVSHPDFPPLKTTLQAPARDVRLQLLPGASLDVELVDEQERPVAHAQVVCLDSHSPPEQRMATTDASGHALLRGLGPGTWRVTALPDEGGRRDARTRVVMPSQGSQHALLRLPERWTLSGQVVDEEDRPLAGVPLRLSGTSAPPLVTVSGPDGGFWLSDLARKNWRLTVSLQDHELDGEASRGLRSPSGSSVLEVSPEQPQVRLVLKAWPRLQGRVVDEAGAPVTSYRLQNQPHAHPEGRFSLPLDGGRTVLSIEAPGREPVELPLSGGARDVGDVVLKKQREAVLSGQVVDALTQAPLAEALIQGARSQALSAAPDGRFRLTPDPRPPPDSPVLLLVERAGYIPQRREVPADAREVRIELQPGATLEGRVEVAGKPVPTGRIRLRSESAEGQRNVEFWEGHYRVTSLAPGTYVLYVQTPGARGPLASSTLHRVSLSAGEHKTEDLLDSAPRSATLEVFVADRSIEVHLLPGHFPLLGPAQGLYRRLPEGLMGRLVRDDVRRFPSLPVGDYTLVAIKRDEAGTEVHQEELEVAEGDSAFTLLPQWTRFEDAASADGP